MSSAPVIYGAVNVNVVCRKLYSLFFSRLTIQERERFEICQIQNRPGMTGLVIRPDTEESE